MSRVYSLIHVLAAVDRDVGASHECRFLGAQVDDQSGDFIGLAEAPERNLRQDLRVEDFLGYRGNHLGADVTRRDGVHGDALARDLERERLGKAVDPGLGGGIVGLAESTLLPVHRRDVDHPAPAALDHAVHHLLGHVEARIEVGAHHRVPVGLGHLLERHVARDAGVVDQDVDHPDLGLDRVHLARAVVVVDHVHRESAEVVAAALHLFQPRSVFRIGGRIGDDHAVARVGHLGRDRFAEAAHASGHNGDPLLCHGLLQACLPWDGPVYIMCMPPLTEMLAPVMYPASSEARKATTAAISSGRASRPMGMAATIWSRISCRIAMTMSVSTYPGDTVLTVTPFLTTSWASASAKPAMPALAAE